VLDRNYFFKKTSVFEGLDFTLTGNFALSTRGHLSILVGQQAAGNSNRTVNPLLSFVNIFKLQVRLVQKNDLLKGFLCTPIKYFILISPIM